MSFTDGLTGLVKWSDNMYNMYNMYILYMLYNMYNNSVQEFCMFLHVYICDCEKYILQGCDAMNFDSNVQIGQRKPVPPL